MSDTNSPSGDEATFGVIEPIEIQTEMEQSFLDYAMSVIVSRALPDARDGLKPVHRRILWSMHDQGHRPDRSHVKCATVVGDVMGKYHPHGDTAIYDALVRLGVLPAPYICDDDPLTRRERAHGFEDFEFAPAP